MFGLGTKDQSVVSRLAREDTKPLQLSQLSEGASSKLASGLGKASSIASKKVGERRDAERTAAEARNRQLFSAGDKGGYANTWDQLPDDVLSK